MYHYAELRGGTNEWIRYTSVKLSKAIIMLYIYAPFTIIMLARRGNTMAILTNSNR